MPRAGEDVLKEPFPFRPDPFNRESVRGPLRRARKRVQPGAVFHQGKQVPGVGLHVKRGDEESRLAVGNDGEYT